MARTSTWLRASDGGLLRVRRNIGDFVNEGDVVGVISDPFGGWESEICATIAGLIIGGATMPMVNQGDAIFHIASLTETAASASSIDAIDGEFESNRLFDHDEL